MTFQPGITWAFLSLFGVIARLQKLQQDYTKLEIVAAGLAARLKLTLEKHGVGGEGGSG